MKKINLATSLAALLVLAACSAKEETSDTNGAINAKVVTEIPGTEIIISEDSNLSADEMPSTEDFDNEAVEVSEEAQANSQTEQVSEEAVKESKTEAEASSSNSEEEE